MEARMSALTRCTAIALALVVAVASPAFAGGPSAALTVYVDKLFTVLDDPELKAPARAAERQRKLRAMAEEALDFRESARRALGSHWEPRTEVERGRFVRLFTDLIDQAYLSRLSRDGERLALDGETISGTEATIKGRALSKSGSATPVMLSMSQGADGRWRVYDVSFEGMSLVSNYRAQFNKIIRASSFEELLVRLEQKTRAEAQASTGEPAKTNP
jgi:phospholipid transport system substrate-binding protein